MSRWMKKGEQERRTDPVHMTLKHSSGIPWPRKSQVASLRNSPLYTCCLPAMSGEHEGRLMNLGVLRYLQHPN